MMHRVLVDEKKWISEPQFLHALNFCMLLPGPEAQQLATYVGWLLHRAKGGVAAGLLFILPGLCIILGLSAIYMLWREIGRAACRERVCKYVVISVDAVSLQKKRH